MKTFESFTNKKESMIDTLNSLLLNRYKSLIKFDKNEKEKGYQGMDNIRLENNTILFDTQRGKDIVDWRYVINGNDVTFWVVGNEGENKYKFSLNDDVDVVTKTIKKLYKTINSN
jgi:hypothetical protein